MREVFICSSCDKVLPVETRIAVPWYNETMESVVTAHVCDPCLAGAIDRAKSYLAQAAQGEGWQEDGGLKHNEVVEKFVGFLLRHNLGDLAIDVRYSDSLDAGVDKINKFLEEIRSGSVRLRG